MKITERDYKQKIRKSIKMIFLWNKNPIPVISLIISIERPRANGKIKLLAAAYSCLLTD